MWYEVRGKREETYGKRCLSKSKRYGHNIRRRSYEIRDMR